MANEELTISSVTKLDLIKRGMAARIAEDDFNPYPKNSDHGNLWSIGWTQVDTSLKSAARVINISNKTTF